MPVKVGLKFIEIWKDSMEKQVCLYEQENAEKGQIVFYGPSNFTRWAPKYGMRPLREDILGKSGKPCAINRGFGSSCPEHQLYYYPRLVRPLEPKVLVYTAASGNSLAFGYTPEETFELAQRVVIWALTDFPDIHIYLVGNAPRKEMDKLELEKRQHYNTMLQEFAEKTPTCHFVNPLEHLPFRAQELYVADGVHFNQQGYDLYADYFREILKDELENY